MERKSPWDLVLAVLFIALAAMIFSNVRQYYASRKWPVEDGVVTSSWKTCVHGRRGTSCNVYVDYSCGVCSGQATMDDNSLFQLGEAGAQEIVDAYPAGKSLRARCDRSSGRSWLEDVKPKNAGFGLLFLAMAGFFIFAGGRGRS